MKVACVFVEHFPFKIEFRENPIIGEYKAVIIFKRQGSRSSVIDVSPSLGSVGYGMPLQEAVARYPEATIVESDLGCYEREFDKLVAALSERSPVVERSALGRLYVGLDGLRDTYGTEKGLINSLMNAVPQHLYPRVGVSDGKFVAYLAALCATPGRAYKISGNVREVIAGFRVDVLPVSWQVKARLKGFGLDTLGEIASLPLGAFEAQFGVEGRRLWKLARGLDDDPLIPEKLEEVVSGTFSFGISVSGLEPILMAVDHLLGDLFGRADMKGRYVRFAQVSGAVLNQVRWNRKVLFKTPAGNKEKAYLAIKAKLDGVRLHGPLEDITVTLSDLTSENGIQESLFQEMRKKDRLREVVAQLKTSQGSNPILQVKEMEPWSRIPERRMALVTYDP